LIVVFTGARETAAIAFTAFKMWRFGFLEETSSASAESTYGFWFVYIAGIVDEEGVSGTGGTVIWTGTIAVVASSIAGNACSAN